MSPALTSRNLPFSAPCVCVFLIIVAMNDDYFPVSLQHQSFHCLVENLLLEMCAERGLSQAYHTRDSGSLPIQSISDLY